MWLHRICTSSTLRLICPLSAWWTCTTKSLVAITFDLFIYLYFKLPKSVSHFSLFSLVLRLKAIAWQYTERNGLHFREFEIKIVTTIFYQVSPKQYVLFLVLRITFHGKLRISMDVETVKKWLFWLKVMSTFVASLLTSLYTAALWCYPRMYSSCSVFIVACLWIQ